MEGGSERVDGNTRLEAARLLDSLASSLAEQMAALNLCKQALREATQKVEQQSRQIDQLKQSLKATKAAEEPAPLPAPGWKAGPVQSIRLQRPEKRLTPPGMPPLAPGGAAPVGQEVLEDPSGKAKTRLSGNGKAILNDPDGSAPTTVLRPPDLKDAWVQAVLHELQKHHPQWVWEYGTGGSVHLACGKVILAIYPEEPLRIQIKTPKKENRRLADGIQKLNQSQETWEFRYAQGEIVCETLFTLQMEAREAAAYCEAALRNYFKGDYQG